MDIIDDKGNENTDQRIQAPVKNKEKRILIPKMIYYDAQINHTREICSIPFVKCASYIEDRNDQS